MKARGRRILWIVATPLIVLGLLSFFYGLGLRVNWTDSMPRGLYLLKPATEPLKRGDIVTLCLEPNHPYTRIARERGYLGSGSCPSGLKPLLKRLAGVPGDLVEVSPNGISINGSLMASTMRPERDSQNRPMPPSMLQDGFIPENYALVISQENGGSFDSRHFGLVPLDSLTKVTPILTEH